MPLRREQGFLPDLSAIPADVAKRAKMMWVNYPNNPTAALATRDFYARVVEFATSHDIIVASDVAYSEVFFDGEPPISFLETPGAKEVGIEFQSLSKTYNMTGWRIGFAVGNAALVGGLGKVKTNTDSGAFEAVQAAAVAALSSSQEPVAKMRAIYRERREVLCGGLERAGFEVLVPKATFYVLVVCPKGALLGGVRLPPARRRRRGDTGDRLRRGRRRLRPPDPVRRQGAPGRSGGASPTRPRLAGAPACALPAAPRANGRASPSPSPPAGCAHPPPPANTPHRDRQRRAAPRRRRRAPSRPPPGPIHDLVIRGGTIYDGSGARALRRRRGHRRRHHRRGRRRSALGKTVRRGARPGGRARLRQHAVARARLARLRRARRVRRAPGRDARGHRRDLALPVRRARCRRSPTAASPSTSPAWSPPRRRARSRCRRKLAPSVAGGARSACAPWWRGRWTKARSASPRRSSTRPTRPSPPTSWSRWPRSPAQKGGLYAAHIRSEGARLAEAIDEMIAIGRRAHIPVEIYHFKQAGKQSWGKLDDAIRRVEAARAAGVDIAADMYTYDAASTGLDAAMPPWVRAGRHRRLAQAARRSGAARPLRPRHAGRPRHLGELLRRRRPRRHAADRVPRPRAACRSSARRWPRWPARAASRRRTRRWTSSLEDGSRAQVIYFLMSEDNVRREVGLPWMSFGSDSDTRAVDTAKGSVHPRAYGNVARLLGRYVRDEHAATLPDVIRRLTALPRRRACTCRAAARSRRAASPTSSSSTRPRWPTTPPTPSRTPTPPASSTSWSTACPCSPTAR